MVGRKVNPVAKRATQATPSDEFWSRELGGHDTARGVMSIFYPGQLVKWLEVGMKMDAIMNSRWKCCTILYSRLSTVALIGRWRLNGFKQGLRLKARPSEVHRGSGANHGEHHCQEGLFGKVQGQGWRLRDANSFNADLVISVLVNLYRWFFPQIG